MTTGKNPIFNAPPPPKPADKPWFEFRNSADASKPVEILIYEQIGRDYWTDEGIGAKDFVENLKAIPANREIHLRINSPGGNVHDGLAIYNQLRARRNDITAFIDGIAASVASWLPLAAREVCIPKSALFMIHDPWTLAMGTADEMRKAADSLDKHKSTIVDIYAEKTGKPRAEIEDAMRSETWFTGTEAKAFGLADTLLDTPAIQNSFDFSRFQRVPEQLRNQAPSTSAVPPKQAGKSDHMNKEKIIALLKKHGVKDQDFDKLTLEQLENLLDETLTAKNKAPAAPPAPPAPAPDNTILVEFKNELAAMRKQREDDNKARIGREIDQCITENRIDVNEREKYMALCIKDETFLAAVKEFPPKRTDEPVVITGESPQDLSRFITNSRKPIAQLLKGEDISAQVIRDNALGIANLLADPKNAAKMAVICNTNTVDSALKLNVILNDSMRAFARRLAPLAVFSTRFNNVPLEGTDKVEVPYYPLFTTTSINYAQNDGYLFAASSTTDNKEVTIDKRKYQPFTFNSSELRRQPFLDVVRLAGMQVEQLAVDVWTDVLSIVTAANYTATATNVPAEAFGPETMLDLNGQAEELDWPEVGRSAVLGTDYRIAMAKLLTKANEAGTDTALRRGVVGRIADFDVYSSPRVPANSHGLVGFVCVPSAALVATSPIMPAPGVRQQLLRYDVIVDPQTGIAFEYRYWGSPQADTDYEVIEANYGYGLGEVNALIRITNA